MRILIILLSLVFCFKLNAQSRKTPSESVISLFVAVDNRDWNTIKNIFADKVYMDYSSMNGDPAAEVSVNKIVSIWKRILPGFEHTHNQVSNIQEHDHGKTANLSCYSTASHYLKDDKGSLWTVVGAYNIMLVKGKDKLWKINKLIFNFKYQVGNLNLPTKAMVNASIKK